MRPLTARDRNSVLPWRVLKIVLYADASLDASSFRMLFCMVFTSLEREYIVGKVIHTIEEARSASFLASYGYYSISSSSQSNSDSFEEAFSPIPLSPRFWFPILIRITVSGSTAKSSREKRSP